MLREEVGAYMQAIGDYPLLTKEGETYLFGLIDNSEDATTVEWARKKVIESNLRLVVSIAKRYPVSAKYDLMDLIGVGNLGLEHSVDLFKVEKGFKFSTYSSFWIKQKIGRFIDTNTLDLKADLKEVGISRKLESLLESASLTQDSPISQIAEALGVSEVSAERIVGMKRQGFAIMLDKQVSDDGETLLGDLITNVSDEFVDTIAQQDYIERILDLLQECLDEEELEILLDRVGYHSENGKQVSYRELGEKYGNKTPEWLRRRALSILDKVSNHMKNQEIELQS